MTFPDTLDTIHTLLLRDHLTRAAGTAALTGCRKATLVPPLPQRDSVPSPPVRPQAPGHIVRHCPRSEPGASPASAEHHQQKADRPSWIFMSKKCIFHHRVYFSSRCAGGAGEVPAKAKGASAVLEAPSKDVARAAAGPKHRCHSVPIPP